MNFSFLAIFFKRDQVEWDFKWGRDFFFVFYEMVDGNFHWLLRTNKTATADEIKTKTKFSLWRHCANTNLTQNQEEISFWSMIQKTIFNVFYSLKHESYVKTCYLEKWLWKLSTLIRLWSHALIENKFVKLLF